MPIRTHTFCGQKYYVVFGEDVCGTCDVTPSDMNRHELCIFEGRENNLSYLDTVVHEAIHACGEADEAKTTQMAKDVSRFLWRIGYRLKNNGES